jgi:hypothetical protein
MISFNVTLEVEDSFVEDVLTTAFEGGINYWCSNVTVVEEEHKNVKYFSQVISKGGTLRLKDLEDGKEYILTEERFFNGLRKYVKAGGTLDLCQLDADDADKIVQYAIFDELVYS